MANGTELQPEDEMRLILFQADERALKWMVIRRLFALALATTAVVEGGLEWTFFVVMHGVFLALIVWDYTRRARLLGRLKSEGVNVPASLAKGAAS